MSDKHQYARCVDGEWVHASDGVRGAPYFCGCPDKHRLKFVEWSGREDKREFQSYFAHISDKSGESVKVSCREGGESQKHKDAKQVLREKFGMYKFAIKRCRDCCKKVYWRAPIGARVELEVTSDDKHWRYDCMVMDGDKKVMALEVYHTHKTGVQKTCETRDDGIEIAEFDADDILNIHNSIVELPNHLCKSFSCSACVEQERIMAIAREAQNKAAEERKAQEKIWKVQQEAVKAREDAVRAEKERILRQERQEVEDKKYCYKHWESELKLIQYLDSENFYEWDSSVKAVACFCMPLPVPSECFDFTPPELWPIVRSCFSGVAEMPSAVPKDVWERNWRKQNPDKAKSGEVPPPAPAFWKCYWGKFRGRALENNRRAAKKPKTADKKGAKTQPIKQPEEDQEPLPPVYPPRLSAEFWKKYFDIFPAGHSAPGYSSVPFRNDPSPYSISGGQLCVNVSSDAKIFQPSTGVDAWDDRGNWLGPG